MENYNNYQDIINAIKAEYVIVRDLKRVANAKKRELNNAQSFVNRKGNEESTLETRITNAKQDAFTRADNALDTIQSSIDSGYKSALSQSIVNLATIEAELTKLQNLQSAFPEKWEAFSQNETNSINSLKGVLTSTINDVKFIYENDIMESYKFETLKDETRISIENSGQNDIIAHYDTLVYNVKQLIQSTNTEFQSYVTEAIELEDELRVRKDTLVSKTRELVQLKSELADLLDSNASQSEIDSKEEAIDLKKSEILTWANESKEKHYAIDVFYTQKHKRFSVYFSIISSLYDDVTEWKNRPGIQQLLSQSKPDTGRDIQRSIREFQSSLLVYMQDKLGESNILYNELVQIIDTTNYASFNGDFAMSTEYQKGQILDNITNYVYSNQEGKYELSKSVQEDTWGETFNYLEDLHQRAATYIQAKRFFDKNLDGYNDVFNNFTQQYDVANNQYAASFESAVVNSEAHIFEESKKTSGTFTGTSEQESTYLDLINLKRIVNGDFVHNSYKLSLLNVKDGLVRHLFPDFFAEYTPLYDTKVSTIAAYLALQPQYDSLNEEVANYFNLFNSYPTDLGSIDSSFDIGSGFNDYVTTVAIQSDGKILVGGNFTSYNGTSASKLIRLNLDGSIDTTFGEINYRVFKVSVQSGGKIIVVGDFTSYNGTDVGRIIRLNGDGTLDNSFVSGTGFDNVVYTTTIQSDDKILVGGQFTSYNGTSASKFIRLNSDGSVDTSFPIGTGCDAEVYSIVILSDSKIMVAGNFTTYNGTEVGGIVKLRSGDGSLDEYFNIGTGFVGDVRAIAEQSDRKIIATGQFTSCNGTAANYIIRLNSDGSIDNSFVTGSGLGNMGLALHIQANGKIILTGNFESYNGTNVNRIIRLNSDGSIDTSFVYGSGLRYQGGNAFAVQLDGKLIVGGYFEQYNGNPSSKIARLIIELSPEAEDAYTNWQQSEAAFQSFKDDVFTPAGDARDLAENALNDFKNTVGQLDAFGWSFSVSEIETILETVRGLILDNTEIENQISEIQSDINTIISEMNFRPATLEDKIEARGYISDMTYKAYNANVYWSNFTTKHLIWLESMKNKVKYFFDQLSSHQSTEVEALDQLKSYLDGNTAYSTWKNGMNYGERVLVLNNGRAEFVEANIRQMFDMDSQTYGQYFSLDNCTAPSFAQSPDFLSERLRLKAQSTRLNATQNFIDQVIEFVNTGVGNF